MFYSADSQKLRKDRASYCALVAFGLRTAYRSAGQFVVQVIRLCTTTFNLPATGERDLDGTGNIDLHGFLEIVIALIGAFFRASCSLLVADLNDLIRVDEVVRGNFD
jgi:hypothetical protein